jgi:hypothetical protein
MLFLLPVSLIYFVNIVREEKPTYFNYLEGINKHDVQSITISVEASETCRGGEIEIDKSEFQLVLNTARTFSMLDNQNEWLIPTEVFEIDIVLKNQKDQLSLILFNSRKFGGVIRFTGNEEKKLAAFDVLNEPMLQFVQQKCKEKNIQ